MMMTIAGMRLGTLPPARGLRKAPELARSRARAGRDAGPTALALLGLTRLVPGQDRQGRRSCCPRVALGLAGRRGMTVLELLIASILGASLLGLVVALLYSGFMALTNAEDRLDPRERASAALVRMRAELLDAWLYRIDESGRSLIFRTDRGDGELRLDESKGRLELRPPGETGVLTLLGTGVAGFRIEQVRFGLLGLSLEVRPPQRRNKPVQQESFTVREDIFLPALGSRNQTPGWNPVVG